MQSHCCELGRGHIMMNPITAKHKRTQKDAVERRKIAFKYSYLKILFNYQYGQVAFG